MSLGEHLVELRKRLMIAAIAILVGLVAGWFLADWVWDMLRQPVIDIQEQQGRDATINYQDITSAFDTKLQIALFIAIIIACPVWLYQIWAFLAPGLTGKEKRYAIAFIGSAVPLFLGGAFAGWLVIPNIVRLLTSFAPEEDAAFINARQYLDFSVKLLLAVGVAFVMPVLLVLLNFLGVLRGMTLLKSWRVAILCIVLFAAMATPAADLLSMFLLALPIVLLYFGAVAIAILHDRRADKRRATELADYDLEPGPGGATPRGDAT
ncbi:twin-arginine translocase subunit TatC [Leucobacter sp. CSA1]|uniref:Sec-independent protein translocase protein TatC n=1 Tax=Leucobacter chromiisoli TaxID=2796471 RepID=A0A934UUR9_9MICO|nr:twin-arginine translocase subunit TatC [Leucobacter chromiisoli]MBK0419105.1 twin-arginine translocase subunit TatC [Leucobacter chromiisoli]